MVSTYSSVPSDGVPYPKNCIVRAIGCIPLDQFDHRNGGSNAFADKRTGSFGDCGARLAFQKLFLEEVSVKQHTSEVQC